MHTIPFRNQMRSIPYIFIIPLLFSCSSLTLRPQVSIARDDYAYMI